MSPISSSSGLKGIMLQLCGMLEGTTVFAELAFEGDNLAVLCN